MGLARALLAPLLTLSLLLLAVLLWDLSGWDLPVARWLGNADGFAARHSFWASTVLHEGGRWLALLLALLLAVDAWRSAPPLRPGPTRRQRRWALLAMLLLALVVPLLKRYSLTSCPWSLAEFGGSARWVSHWQWGVADGGPGRCFPSGHTVGSFAVFSVWLWLWWPWRAQRPWVFALMGLGVVGGTLIASLGQWARGAHFVSHSLWSAWLCAALGYALLCVAPAALKPQTAAAPESPSPAPR